MPMTSEVGLRRVIKRILLEDAPLIPCAGPAQATLQVRHVNHRHLDLDFSVCSAQPRHPTSIAERDSPIPRPVGSLTVAIPRPSQHNRFPLEYGLHP